MKTVSALTVIALAAALPVFAKGVVVNQAITEPEVLDAQQGWCQALVDIAATATQSGQPAAKAVAEQVIDAVYGYQMGAALFKPTLTANPQTFRTTRAGALSYFMAGNSATTMGKVQFTGKDGKITSVDKTRKFVKDDAGRLRIVVHHSSLKYSDK